MLLDLGECECSTLAPQPEKEHLSAEDCRARSEIEIEDGVVARPLRRVTPVVVEAAEDNVTGVASIALFGELPDHLGPAEVVDRHNLRPIGTGGYSGDECYRPLVELQLASGDFLSDVSLLGDEATQRLRGNQALPSHTTLFRFLAGEV